MRFDWDPDKEGANLEKHGVSFAEAVDLFSSGDDYLEIYDEDHSEEEDRFIAIGVAAGRVLVVVFAEWPDDTIRVISVRPATPRETRLFRDSMRDKHEQDSRDDEP